MLVRIDLGGEKKTQKKRDLQVTADVTLHGQQLPDFLQLVNGFHMSVCVFSHAAIVTLLQEAQLSALLRFLRLSGGDTEKEVQATQQFGEVKNPDVSGELTSKANLKNVTGSRNTPIANLVEIA